jgi:N-acyl-D-aspartate/D-glutamate deacylase
MPVSSTLRVNFESGFVLDSLPGWSALFELPTAQRLRALRDPEQRGRMREGVENGDTTLVRRFRDWGQLIVEQTFTPETAMFGGRRLSDVAADGSRDAFDTLLDIVIADGLRTVIVLPPVGNDAESWRLRRQVWADDRAVIGGSDSGAHLDMIDTFVYATSLLGPITRDGLVGLEEAVRLLSDVPARLYGLRGRGRLSPGYQADVIVFDPATIGPGPMRTVTDLPGGASRLFADATGIEHVFVNGTETVRRGALTGATPGTTLRSGRDTDTVHPQDLPMAGAHLR